MFTFMVLEPPKWVIFGRRPLLCNSLLIAFPSQQLVECISTATHGWNNEKKLSFLFGRPQRLTFGSNIAWLDSRLQNKVLCTIGYFPRHTPVCELHKAFNIPYIYDYVTKLCRKEAKIVQNHGNADVRNIGQGELQHRTFKRLKLGGSQAYHRSSVCTTVVV
jgi:hypothetical protein